MRNKLLILTTFLLASITMNAQVNLGSIQISNFGDHYRITHVGTVSNPNPPDSVSLMITVIHPGTMASEVRNLPINSFVGYKMGGTNIVVANIIWWRNGRKSRTTISNTCGFFLNPLNGFEKVY